MTSLTSYLRARAHHTVLLGVITVTMLGISAGLACLALEQHQVVAQATARNDKLLAIQAASATPTTGRAEQDNLKRWTQLKMERDFPWAAVFLAVEKVSNPDVELLEFKPEKLNRKITLGGEARTRKALVAYLEALSKQPALRNVYLVHQQSVQRDALETTGFEIRATLGE